MPEPLYLGVNELSIPVYQIEEGEMRPMVDKDGKIVCGHCTSRAVPLRISLALERIEGVEWVLLCCPHCHSHQAHCMMKVKLMGKMMAGAPSLTEIDHPDPEHEQPVEPMKITGASTHYADPKEKVKAGIDAAVAHGKKGRG